MTDNKWDDEIFSTRLFFGVVIEGELEIFFERGNASKIALFINNNDIYLQKVVFEEKNYLGKILPDKFELSQLDLLQANINSLIAQIVPDYLVSKNNFVLFSIFIDDFLRNAHI